MEIELVNNADNHVKYGIIYTREDVQECLDQEVEAIKPEVKLKGFRPGKVPNDYIIKVYGEKLRIQAMNKKVTADIMGILKDNKHELASQPVYNFRNRQEIDDTNFYVELDLFLMPNLPEIDFEKIVLQKSKPNEEAFQEILDKNLLMFQLMTAEFNPVEAGVAQENDRVVFSFETFADGEAVQGLNGTLQPILGQEQIPALFEGKLKGMEIGQELSFDHKYSKDDEDILSPSIADKDVTFKLKLEAINRPVIKELDEAKIQKIGFKDYDHLFEVLEKNTWATMDNIAFNQMKYHFFEKFNEFYADVKIPDFILEQEAHLQGMQQLAAQNPEVDIMDAITTGTLKLDISDAHKERAKEAFFVGLFVKKYSKDNNIDITEAELTQELEKHLPELTQLNKNNPEQKEKNYRQVFAKARAIVMETKVLKHIFERITVNEVLLSKDDFLKSVKDVSLV